MAEAVVSRQGLADNRRLRRPLTEPSSPLPRRKSHEGEHSNKDIWIAVYRTCKNDLIA
jgi:hypothetical protein